MLLDLRRKFEQRWAARFLRPPPAPRAHRPEGQSQQLAAPKPKRKTRRREPAGSCDPRLSTYPEIFGRLFAAVRHHFVAHLRALIQIAQTCPLDGRDMDEHV